jgi:hypothetical protein
MTPSNGREPVLVLTYGPSGSGKTTDDGYSFPNAVFLAAPGALHSIRAICGYQPRQIEANTVDDATKFLREVNTNNGIDAVVVDDFSFLAEQQFAAYDKRFSGFTLWGKLRDSILDFRNAARTAGVHVILNCWEAGPKMRQDGTRVRGGPMLSGRLPEQVPAMCDMVLRCGHEAARRPWPGVYQCSYSTDYVMKDRLDIAARANPAPMNLGELLRAAGYQVSRHPDLDWQEAVVENLTAQMMESEDQITAANAAYATLLESGVAPTVARWTLRDATDRVVIRRALDTRNSTFF